MGLPISIIMTFVIAALAPFLYSRLKERSGIVLGIASAALTFYYAQLAPSIVNGEPLLLSYHWIEALNINISFRVDGLSLLFLLLVSAIGTLVVIFASGYLKGEEKLGRFYTYLFLFMGSMLGVVVADNLLVLFVFWELTSLSSFLLIGFKNQLPEARKSAHQALIVTSCGGLALLAGIILLGQISGTFEISLLDGELIRSHTLYPSILILFVIGAFTKSAQMPFHFWLPNAMVAPTPVSAFLHSATMVKAGVFLLARLFPALGGTELWQDILIPIGCITAVMAPLLALEQTDLKRLLAYSTIGTLGMLVLLLGVGTTDAINAAVTYLMIHSLYKGALFMVAGSVDHGAGTRDVLGLCGLARSMPLTSVAAVLAALSMAGFPPLFGFIGKELAYAASLEAMNAELVFILTVIANIVTVAVAFMVGFEPFMGRKLLSPQPPHEVSASMWAGPLVLAALGLAIGLMPGLFAEALISEAADSILGRPEPLSLKAWHGFNIVLAFSAITLIGGTLVFIFRTRVRKLAITATQLTKTGPSDIYEKLVGAVLKFANDFTRVTQNGSLSRYVLIIAAALLGAISFTAFSNEGEFFFAKLQSPTWQESVACLVISAAAITAMISRSRILGITSIGIIGFMVAVLYGIYSAPDVALTQILVETLSVVLGVFLIAKLPRITRQLTKIESALRFAIAVTLGLIMTSISFLLISSPSMDPASRFFKEKSFVEAHGKNTVNVILVDFRALDTLGEVTVLAIASIGVLTLLTLRISTSERGHA